MLVLQTEALPTAEAAQSPVLSAEMNAAVFLRLFVGLRLHFAKEPVAVAIPVVARDCRPGPDAFPERARC